MEEFDKIVNKFKKEAEEGTKAFKETCAEAMALGPDCFSTTRTT